MKSYTLLSLLTALLISCQLCAQQPSTDPIAEDMLIFQRTSGGWPKHIPLRGKKEIKVNYKELKLTDQERRKIKADSAHADATYDNNATTKEIRYLISAYQTTQNKAYLHAAERGIRYILAGQYASSGGWPQFYPLRGGYPDHITYNDNSMINCMTILREVTQGTSGFDAVDPSLTSACAQAIEKGIGCILKTQIVVNGTRTVWCAQHDEFTYAPAKARAFELVSFSGSESVEILRFLMGIEQPSDEVKQAIIGGVEWLDAHRIAGKEVKYVDSPGGERGYDKLMVDNPESVIWARFYDLQTGEPFVCGRDGVKKTDFQQIEYERRVGYAWYGTWPKQLIAQDFPKWKQKNGL